MLVMLVLFEGRGSYECWKWTTPTQVKCVTYVYHQVFVVFLSPSKKIQR